MHACFKIEKRKRQQYDNSLDPCRRDARERAPHHCDTPNRRQVDRAHDHVEFHESQSDCSQYNDGRYPNAFDILRAIVDRQRTS